MLEGGKLKNGVSLEKSNIYNFLASDHFINSHNLIFGLGIDIVRGKLNSIGLEGLNETMSW